MSGFAGVIFAEGETPDPILLERMAARIAFRGPDATQIWTLGAAGFCFTLLRTGPAPQASKQPCTLDGRVRLLGDVRLDGRDDLQRKLEQAGESLPSGATDEDLVLYAWRHWGEKSLAELAGDFAFVLWDSEECRLWCVRDLLGIRPFYYARAGGRFYFSNTLDVLRLAPEISSALDPVFIGDFLLQESCTDPARSAFRDISRLPGGHVLRYSENSFEVRHYTSLRIEEPLWFRQAKEYVENFRTVFESAVRDRLPDGSTAILMSGGLDSTSVATIANKIARARGTPHALRAYTVDYRPLFEDEEGAYASIAAKHLGIPIEIFSGAACVPYEGWGNLLPRTPEPCNEPFLLLNQKQYRLVRAHARVALSGLGGDDLLNGQAWPYLIYLLRRWSFGRIAADFGGYLFKYKRMPPMRGGFRARLRKWVGDSDPKDGYPTWLNPKFEKAQGLREKWLELQAPAKTLHPWYPLGYAGLTGHHWSGILEAEDAALTGAPVELRAPLLDQRVLRYLLRIPPVPWAAHKELLRQTVRGLLPEEIRLRPKTPLLGDPLRLHVNPGPWRLSPLAPEAAIREFLDWEKFCATLESSSGSMLWTQVRGLSLNYWMKDVENR